MSDYFTSCIFEKSRCFYALFVPMSSLVELVDTIYRCLIAYLYSRYSVASQQNNLFWSYPIRTSLYRHTYDTTSRGFVELFRFFKRCTRFCFVSFFYFEARKLSLWEVCFFDKLFHLVIAIARVIYSLNKRELIVSRVYWPCPSYDTDVVFFYLMTGYFKRSQTIVDLEYRIKYVELSTHNRRLVWDIAFWEVIKSRAVNTLPRTTKKLRQETYYRYSWETTHSSLPENFFEADIFFVFSLLDMLVIPLKYLYRRDRSGKMILLINSILYFMKGVLCDIFLFESLFDDLI